MKQRHRHCAVCGDDIKKRDGRHCLVCKKPLCYLCQNPSTRTCPEHSEPAKEYSDGAYFALPRELR